MKRLVIILIVALVVLVPGVLAVRFWQRAARPGAPAPFGVEPAVSTLTVPPGRANPLASFNLRNVSRPDTRIKLWVTPPGSEFPYGVEFTSRGGEMSALVQRRGSAEHTPVPMPSGWVDRLNEAIRLASARGPERGIELDLAVEHPGELPEKYLVRLDAEGPGWAVLEEILSHYGLLSYTVKKGDTPSSIAKKVLGDAQRWPEILAVNPGLKADKMKPGDVIHVPRK